MNQNNQKIDSIHQYDDEVDLKELLITLWLKKNFIIGITAAITILAGVYAFNVGPIYEAKALVEIGKKIDRNGGKLILVDSVPVLIEKLNILFIQLQKNEKRKNTITSISKVKEATGVIQITSEGESNELATNEINTVVGYINDMHREIIDETKDLIKNDMNNLKAIIDTISNQQIINDDAIDSLDQEINTLQNNIDNYQIKIDKVVNDIKEILKNDPAQELSAFQLLEKRNVSNVILQLNTKLANMHSRKQALNDRKDAINDRKDAINNNRKASSEELMDVYKSMLLPHNYKNTEVIGGIVTNNYPIKPKKKIIVSMAFIAGFILSIFLILIMNVFRSEGKKAMS